MSIGWKLNSRESQKKKEQNDLRSVAFVAPKKKKNAKGKKGKGQGMFNRIAFMISIGCSSIPKFVGKYEYATVF